MQNTFSSNIYANFPLKDVQIDEVRYQTIGKGHGFAELEGVPFKIADKYQQIQQSDSDIYQLTNLHMGGIQSLDETLYTFALERKVIGNMEFRGC